MMRAAVAVAAPSPSSGFPPSAISDLLFSRKMTGQTCSPARAGRGGIERSQRALVRQRKADRVCRSVEQQQHAVGLVDLAAAPGREEVACEPVVGEPERGHSCIAE